MFSMSEEEQNKESGQVTRREFLVGAGFIAGGAAIGAGIAYPLASGGDAEEITKYACASCGQEFATKAALVSHVEDVHPTDVVIEGVPGVITLTVNGRDYTVKVKANWTLAYVIREKLGLIGTKRGCDEGQCGVCTLIMDGRAVSSCLVLAVEAEGKNVETIEGVGDGELHPIQQAFIDYDGLQCGFCTPGQIMSAKALLDVNPSPTADEVKDALSNNLCRCGSYRNILAAVLAVGK
jgi:aerobic-type carbon monoxide dehydrogenase small subunit (CoxS/CutS family)